MAAAGGGLLGLVLIYGVWVRSSVVLQDTSTLVQMLPDDSFFYFQVARQIVSGHGSTFDGLYPTNGYHPLWMAVLVLLTTVTADPLRLLRLGLAVGIALNVLTASVLYDLVRRATTLVWIPPLVVAVYFWNGRVVLSSFNGLETALSTALYAVASWILLTHLRGPAARRCEVIFAGVLGLLFLARTDNVFALAVLGLLAVLWAGAGQRLHRGAVLLLGLTLVAGPWLIWNTVAFGSPVQTSGLAFPYVLQESYRLAGQTDSALLAHSLSQWTGFVKSGLYPMLGFPRPLFAASALFTFVICVGGWWVRDLSPRAFLRAAGVLGLGLAGAGAGLGFVHTFVRWYPRTWYFDSLIFLVTLIFGWALGRAGDLIANWYMGRGGALGGLGRWAGSGGVAVTLGLLLLAAMRGAGQVPPAPYPHQLEMLTAADWLQTHLAPSESAAAFNPGIMAYFSGRSITDLDGVINDAAYRAIQRGDLLGLLHESGATYYLDFDPLMLDQFRPFLGSMDPVQMIPVYDVPRAAQRVVNVQLVNSTIRVYRLVWRP